MNTTARNDIRRTNCRRKPLLCIRIIEVPFHDVVSRKFRDISKACFASAMRARPGQPWHYAANAKCSATIQTMTGITICGLVLKTNRTFSFISFFRNSSGAKNKAIIDI